MYSEPYFTTFALLDCCPILCSQGKHKNVEAIALEVDKNLAWFLDLIYSAIDVGSDVTRNIRGASQSTKLWELQGGFPRSFRQGTKLQSITHQRKRPKFGFENTSDLFLIPTGLCFGVPHFEIRRSKIGMCSSKNSRFPCFQFL